MSPPGPARALLLSLSLLAAPAWAQEQRRDLTETEAHARAGELTPEARRAIEDGVRWLAREQIDSSGRWPSRPPRYQMSVTALSGLALLAHGDTPDVGPYSREVRRCLLWILGSQRAEGRWEGLIFDLPDEEHDDRPMHGHGFALLFLAECYGQTGDPVLRERMRLAIDRALRLTERSISPDGGWFYHPADSAQHRDEGSVTVTQIQAMRAAHNAGFYVDPTVVERAVSYIKGSQQADGGVKYTLRWGKASAALTAAGIAVLQGAGEYHGDAIEKGYAYLRVHLTTDLPERQRFFFYTHLYAAQAMFQRGGPEWAAYFPRIRHELLAMRRGNPYWDSLYGKSYGTAIALAILQLPQRYLPVHQR